ncbi:MAG TPA: hypothetical protein VK276_02630 [Rubrobacteraceae bacterium]|jgi:hypothetical protein|nr:hypothetical protein [Rubrobacteraceae bacterium]
MYQINPTEVWRERHLALLREAEERRHARQMRRAPRQMSPRAGSQPHTAGLGRVIASWGRTNVPFFRA